MTAGTLWGIAGQTLVWLLVGWAVADLSLKVLRVSPVPSVAEGSPTPGPGIQFRQLHLGAPERLLLAIVGFVGFSCVLMTAHIATSGWVLGSRIGPALASLAMVGAWLWFSRPWKRWALVLPPFRSLVAAALLGIAIFTLFVMPAMEIGSSVRTGDPPWHLGWTQQILGGDTLPTGPAPDLARNAYPWGLHATMATLVQDIPGTDPLVALETLHLILAASIPLAAACLARQVRTSSMTGAWAAWAAALIGGWGWLQTQEPTYISSPREARFGADLVAASPNSAYELLPPALPRELGLALLVAGAMLLLVYMRSHEIRLVFAGGVVIGIAGLVSLPMFVVGVVWIAALALVHQESKRRMFAYSLAPALGVLLLWLGPVILQSVRHGGFVNITPRLGVEWHAVTAFMSWGILLPLALVGGATLWRARPAGWSPVLALVVATLLLLGAGMLRSAMDWGLAGNATLLHQGRFWPPLHLLAAVLAAQVLAAMVPAWGRRGWGVAGVLVLLGLPSIILASQGLKPLLEERVQGFEYSSPDVQDPDGFIRRATEVLGPDDVVLVLDSDRLAFRLFEFSGVRLANFDDPRVASNDLRIRFRDLAAEWDLIAAEGGFQPDFVAVTYDGVGTIGGDEPLATGTFGEATWALFKVEPGGLEQSL